MSEERIALIGGFDYEYPREKSIKRGLESQGFEVLDCRYADEQLFISLRKLLLLPLFYFRIIREFRNIERNEPELSAIVVTKFNHLLLPLAWVLARRHSCPLFYDVFVSLRGTAEMRGIHPVVVRGLALLERTTLKLPDRYLIGTEQLAELNADLSNVPEDRFVIVPPGADEDRFYPRPEVDTCESFTVLYWGNHLPHHGIETILHAADALRDQDDVNFVILGDGPEKDRMERLATELELPNVEFNGRVPWDDLFQWIAGAHVALGVFSKHDRAMASITNKVCEGVAMKKAVITERSPAIEEWFTHRENVFMVPPEDPEGLADAILTLKDDPRLRETIENGARRRHEEAFSFEHVGERLAAGIRAANRTTSDTSREQDLQNDE